MTTNRRRQGLALFAAIGAFIGVVVVLQLWLLSASLASSRSAVAVAAAIGSVSLFVLSAGLLAYVRGFDNDRVRRASSERPLPRGDSEQHLDR